jgi:hypothetical protein
VPLRAINICVADAMKDGNHPQIARPPEQHREEQAYGENTSEHGESWRGVLEAVEV